MKFNRLTLVALATSAFLTACGGGGGGDSGGGNNGGNNGGGEVPTVPTVPTSPGTEGSSLKVFCSGANCGAVSENAYSGSGVGVWQHENATEQPKNVNVNISGVAGKTLYAALVNISPESVSISNNNLNTLLQIQDAGSLKKKEVSADANVNADEVKAQEFHKKLNDFSNDSVKMLKIADPSEKVAAMKLAQANPLVIGETQVFSFYNGVTTTYNNQNFRFVKSVQANDGRTIQYWVQDSEWNPSKIVESDIEFLNTKFLKTYSENKRLNGEPYGTAAEKYSNLIPSANQPINILLGNITPNNRGYGVAGYFYSLNNFLKSAQPTSNEALQVFLDTENIYTLKGNYEPEGSAGREEGLDLTATSLIHEFSHLIAYYERNLVRNVTDTNSFLSESIALSTEFLLQDLAGFKTDIFATRSWPFMVQNTTNKCGIFSWNICTNSYERTSTLMAFMASKYGPAFHQSYVRDISSANMYYMFNNRISGSGQNFTDEVKRFAMLPAGLDVEMPAGFGLGGLERDGLKVKKYNGVLTASGESMTNVQTLPDFGASYFLKSKIQGNDIQKTVIVPAGTALVLMVK